MFIKFSFIYSYEKSVKRTIIKEKLNTQKKNNYTFSSDKGLKKHAFALNGQRSSLGVGGISKLKPTIILESKKMSNQGLQGVDALEDMQMEVARRLAF